MQKFLETLTRKIPFLELIKIKIENIIKKENDLRLMNK